MPRVTYTEAELRHAWVCARQRAWPDTFEAVMADPARSRLVRIAAARIARGERLDASATVKRPAIVRPDLHAPPAPTSPSLPTHLDRKRAAAGERDDD